MTPWIAKISDVIVPRDVGVQLDDGSYGRAVPLPFYDGLIARALAGWRVFRGQAVAFKWPTDEELNATLRRASLQSKDDTESRTMDEGHAQPP